MLKPAQDWGYSVAEYINEYINVKVGWQYMALKLYTINSYPRTEMGGVLKFLSYKLMGKRD